ncbi:hypothetical protein VSS74_13305 [Conexibacter stalactiti]|uniref:Uncharacterized protein n=1 Tax=Conexibacter stalactiti TaxID=1940611 RepID=A0ABU4HRD3_9ACTN|nr:hypothetical protein [Conexibacter stalactiti]MDW5595319.1 hypothetical protein [Conexibacter stalactiti]MEC5035961.1 hypothetical protein [Conexibacter stalactiti]
MLRSEPTPDPAALADYQRVLDRVFERSRELIESAPTWQAGLYRAVLACYTEMRSNPQALHLHFIATMRDARVLQTRVRHRDRLLALLARTRDDAPDSLHGEFLLNMIHASMRTQIKAGATPPDLDAAEQTFATILWRGAPLAR